MSRLAGKGELIRKWNYSIKIILMFLLVVVTCGCGGGGGGGANSCSILNARVFNGDQCSNTAQTPVVSLSVKLMDGSTQSICTGTLITLNDILTSGHCLLALLEAVDQIADFRIIVGGTADGEGLHIVKVAFHPFYDGSVGSPYDVAMMTLESVPNPPIGPLPLLLSEITGAGSTITAYGYGKNEDKADFTLRAATFKITKIAGGNIFVVNENPEKSICPGDSGGPAVYVTSQGVATLAGVNSFAISLSGSFCESAATEVSGFVDIQNPDILNFILSYAPDAAVG